jgi:hypothetical protein
MTSIPPTDDQRQHPRYAIELDAEIVVGDVKIVGRTRDISRGGFCMQAPRALGAGSSCKVKLALVFSENQFSEHLDLVATIAWCTPVKGSFQIGCSFGKLDPQHVGYLDLFIRFLDEGRSQEEEDEDQHDPDDQGGEP